MTIIIIRATILYILLTFMMKLMGKRQIGEMQVSELVTTVLLSELAVFPITDPDVPLLQGIFPMILISSFEVIISFVSRKSKKFRVFLNGNPIVLYEKSHYIDKNLSKARLSIEDIQAQIRINGYEDEKEVSKIILERTGKMSVIPRKDNSPNQSGE